MKTRKKKEIKLFIGSETFFGSIQGKKESENEKLYRFKIVVNDTKKLVAIPEMLLVETGEWISASPGWRLKDIAGSKSLFLDFGQKRFIIPTDKVWDEIRDALKTYEDKRP